VEEDIAEQAASRERDHGVERRRLEVCRHSQEDKIGDRRDVERAQDCVVSVRNVPVLHCSCASCARVASHLYSLAFHAGLSKGNSTSKNCFMPPDPWVCKGV
jgi:hypothetical protein